MNANELINVLRTCPPDAQVEIEIARSHGLGQHLDVPTLRSIGMWGYDDIKKITLHCNSLEKPAAYEKIVWREPPCVY